MQKQTPGFTIVELLIVIVVIGILAALVLNSFSGAQNKARVAQAASDLKALHKALVQYNADTGGLPCFDHSWVDTQEKLWASDYIQWPRNPWGGAYHWEHAQQGFTLSISVESPGAENAQALDAVIDDDNLSTGILRGSGTRLEYAGMDQNMSFTHCHI